MQHNRKQYGIDHYQTLTGTWLYNFLLIISIWIFVLTIFSNYRFLLIQKYLIRFTTVNIILAILLCFVVLTTLIRELLNNLLALSTGSMLHNDTVHHNSHIAQANNSYCISVFTSLI